MEGRRHRSKRKFIVSYYKIGSFGNDSSATYISPCFLHPTLSRLYCTKQAALLMYILATEHVFLFTFMVMQYLAYRIGAGLSLLLPPQNSTLWTAHHESYRFIPSDSASRFLGAEILDMAGNSLAFADTATSLPGAFRPPVSKHLPGAYAY